MKGRSQMIERDVGFILWVFLVAGWGWDGCGEGMTTLKGSDYVRFLFHKDPLAVD